MDISSKINELKQLWSSPDIQNLQDCYGFNEGNWSDLDIFCGGYVNFGYWEGISIKSQITLSNRVKSSKNLYLHVAKYLNISEHDTVLEIGCGRGAGLLSLLNQFRISKAIGIDLSPAQIVRAKRLVQNIGQKDNSPALYSASADHIQLSAQSVDKILSVEVAQHFRGFRSFAKEAKRILKPNGKVVFAAHFCTSPQNYQKLVDEDLIIRGDHMMPIQFVEEHFKAQGFELVYHSIGRHVFEGFDKWVMQIPSAPQQSHKVYEAYKKGYIDYFVIEAK
jgi:cyclopropane fatty-acyl-phospholipid synthase-like methyltransferase